MGGFELSVVSKKWSFSQSFLDVVARLQFQQNRLAIDLHKKN